MKCGTIHKKENPKNECRTRFQDFYTLFEWYLTLNGSYCVDGSLIWPSPLWTISCDILNAWRKLRGFGTISHWGLCCRMCCASLSRTINKSKDFTFEILETLAFSCSRSKRHVCQVTPFKIKCCHNIIFQKPLLVTPEHHTNEMFGLTMI